MAETGPPYHLQTEQSKTRWVEQIEQHFAAGQYASAQEAAAVALQEFPDDREVQGLELLAEAGIRRSAEAGRLLEQASANLAGGDSEAAVTQLRQAERLDERNTAVRAALVGALVERGRALLASDRDAAEPLVKEALELERSNPLARSLASLIENYRQQGSVVQAREPEKPVESREMANGAEAPSRQQSAHQDTLPASATVVLAADAPAFPPEDEQPPVTAEPPPKPKSKGPILWGAVVVAAIIIAIAAFFAFRHRLPNAAPAAVAVSLSANAPGATFTVDGQPAQASLRLKPGPHTAIAAADGYVSGAQTFTLQAEASQPVKIAFALQPVLPQLHFSSALKAGRLVIDDGAPVELTDGAATLSNLAMGDHTLKVFDGNRQIFSLAFRVQPKQVPSVMAPLTGREARAVVIASMGNSAKIYASPGMKAALGNATMAPVAASGLVLSNLNSSNANLSVAGRSGKPDLLPIDTSAVPAISVVLNGAPER
ncbi:MAG: tetratricopeptide repeat protein, partial [Bryobacteraceae bacterium]